MLHASRVVGEVERVDDGFLGLGDRELQRSVPDGDGSEETHRRQLHEAKRVGLDVSAEGEARVRDEDEPGRLLGPAVIVKGAPEAHVRRFHEPRAEIERLGESG